MAHPNHAPNISKVMASISNKKTSDVFNRSRIAPPNFKIALESIAHPKQRQV